MQFSLAWFAMTEQLRRSVRAGADSLVRAYTLLLSCFALEVINWPHATNSSIPGLRSSAVDSKWHGVHHLRLRRRTYHQSCRSRAARARDHRAANDRS